MSQLVTSFPQLHQVMTKKKATLKDDKSDAEAELKKCVGKKISEMRNSLGYSALTVSEHLGVTRVAVTQIETGRNNISAVALWKLATLFNCEISDFFPDIPDGFALTKVDVRKVAQENEDAATWAQKIFNKEK